MHSVKVSWAGQTFALARCCDSQGKKPRGRRTKEERKELVKSFVKKYQISNNGSFPSLNLTHKEVGGSYYIVREIVREIIQENKVLAPGNSTSRVVLSLEDCLPEQLQEYASPESTSDLLLAINGQAYEDMQKKALNFSAEHHKVNVDIYKSSSEQSFDGNYAACENILEKEFGNSFDDIILGNCHQDDEKMCTVEQHASSKNEGGLNYKHPVEVSLSVSSSSTLDENFSSNTETNMKSQRANGIASSSVQHAVLDMTVPASKTTAMEHTITSDFSKELEMHLDSCLPAQDIPLSSKSSLSISTDGEVREGHSTDNLEAESIEFINDKILHSRSVETHFITTNHETAIYNSSDTSNDGLPEIPLTETSYSCSSECAIGNVEPLTSANYLNMEQSAAVTDPGKAEPEPLARTEHKHYLSSRERGRNSLLKEENSISIKDSHLKQDMPGANPIWSAIKGIIDAFVKFWTED